MDSSKNFKFVRQTQYPFKVVIKEYERGWGSKIDDTLYFEEEKNAREYVEEFNKRNTSQTVPDWYTIAEYVGRV